MTPAKLAGTASVEIAIPVYNEEDALRECIEQIQKTIQKEDLAGYRISLTIVNNASTDKTETIARELVKRHHGVKLINLREKGRGRALRSCWDKTSAQILAYMDADLSADLSYLSPLIKTVAEKEAEIAIGSRLAKSAIVTGRTRLRESMSRGYNLLIKALFCTDFTDAQCGFKAISKEAYSMLSPLIKNQNWFFDSELLIIAHKKGMRIKEIPLTWKDDPGSTVKIAKTVGEDLAGLLRLLVTQPWKSIGKS